LNELFSPKGIYERNDVPIRELEGMEQKKGFLSEPFEAKIMIKENGLKFMVDIEKGQKTGYFLDQQDNRREIQHIVKGADVLGAFCYTGTFEIHAAHFGAKHVLGLDISESAVQQSIENAALNGITNCSFQAINAFDALKQWSKEEKRWDVVMLDPPSFTKTREIPMSSKSSFKVSLGIMPDYTYSGEGIRADGVTDGKLAQRIGIKAGDIILQIGNYPFSDMQSYMGTLNKFSKGEAARVRVKRGNNEIFFDVVF
jgi:hypothetical protein